jgi:hypothetical protein|eukprot:scaffold10556_cov258-Chaetoceros_neogracile.AAC.34
MLDPRINILTAGGLYSIGVRSVESVENTIKYMHAYTTVDDGIVVISDVQFRQSSCDGDYLGNLPGARRHTHPPKI